MNLQELPDQEIYPVESSYFHIVLHIADDQLDPYEYRLLGHYIRVGRCWESVRTTAEICQMSTMKVCETRDRLAEKGWIEIERKGNTRITYLIRVVDRMAENVAIYTAKKRGKQCLPHKHSVSDTNTVFAMQTKEESIKNNSIITDPDPIPPADFVATNAGQSASPLPRSIGEPLFKPAVRITHESESSMTKRAKSTVKPLSEFESLIDQSCKGVGLLRATKIREFLASPVQDEPSPEALWNIDPVFREYVESRLTWFKSLPAKERELRYLINLIRAYDKPKYGWFDFQRNYAPTADPENAKALAQNTEYAAWLDDLLAQKEQ